MIQNPDGTVKLPPREDCPDCKGEGGFEVDISDGTVFATDWRECETCNGTGKVLIDLNAEDREVVE